MSAPYLYDTVTITSTLHTHNMTNLTVIYYLPILAI
jgi:hypothetical protein